MFVLKNTFFLQVAEWLEQTYGHFWGGDHLLVFAWGKNTLLGQMRLAIYGEQTH